MTKRLHVFVLWLVKFIKWYNFHYIERQSTNIVWEKTWLYLITRLTMKLHSIEGKFNSSVFVSEEFLTIMRNLLYRDLTISSFDCKWTFIWGFPYVCNTTIRRFSRRNPDYYHGYLGYYVGTMIISNLSQRQPMINMHILTALSKDPNVISKCDMFVLYTC
jgi:hypothetical protein